MPRPGAKTDQPDRIAESAMLLNALADLLLQNSQSVSCSPCGTTAQKEAVEQCSGFVSIDNLQAPPTAGLFQRLTCKVTEVPDNGPAQFGNQTSNRPTGLSDFTTILFPIHSMGILI